MSMLQVTVIIVLSISSKVLVVEARRSYDYRIHRPSRRLPGDYGEDCQHKACPKIYKPLCARFGYTIRTMGNECEFERLKECWNPKAFVLHSGVCSNIDFFLRCPSKYKPLCGNDCVTYTNACEFQKAQLYEPKLVVISSKNCNNEPACAFPPSIPVDFLSEPISKGEGSGKCAHKSHGSTSKCSNIYKPVCGSDCKTYKNKSVFIKAQKRDRKLRILYKGECRSDCKPSGAVKPPSSTTKAPAPPMPTTGRPAKPVEPSHRPIPSGQPDKPAPTEAPSMGTSSPSPSLPPPQPNLGPSALPTEADDADFGDDDFQSEN